MSLPVRAWWQGLTGLGLASVAAVVLAVLSADAAALQDGSAANAADDQATAWDAAAARERFAAGVEAYRAGDLPTAAVLWTELAAAPALGDDDRGRVALALGNLAFREQRFLEAAARYHGAVLLRPRDADAWHNLELARSRAGLEAADRGDLAATADRLLAAPTADELAGAAWVGLALLALALAWEVRRGGLLPRIAAGGALVLCLGALGWGSWRAATALEDPALVLEATSLRAEPDPGLPVLQSLAAGDEVELLERYAGWARVEAAGRVGWVRGNEVLELYP